MKTAEEWMKQLGGSDSTGEHPPIITINRQIIREIQLDAWRQGMLDAKHILENPGISDLVPAELIELAIQRQDFPHTAETDAPAGSSATGNAVDPAGQG